MNRLSGKNADIAAHYEIVVVGSGYGGGIAASRMARAGRQVCVLERGRELQPGEYPNNPIDLIAHMQTDLPLAHVGSPSALVDLRYNPDINVVLGCGLGGTSLINSGASARPDPRVFQAPCWPAEIRAEAEFEHYYQLAEAMLKPVPYPEHAAPLAKLDALEKSAQTLGAPCYRIPVHTTFDALPGGVNHVGVPQQPCVGCGDCESGCNYGAKNTVLMNYLPDAAQHGAHIFSEIAVRSIARDGNGWKLNCRRLDGDAAGRAVEIRADIVILGAGSLGSTEILLRSAAGGLALSPALGTRFSGNGDMVGFSYNCDVEINSVGCGSAAPDPAHPPGPCVAGAVDARAGRPLDEGLMMECGGVPGAIGGWMPLILAGAAKLLGEDTDCGLRDALKEAARELQSKLGGPYVGAMRNTQTYITVAHDDSGGRMYLHDDRLRISWPGVGAQPHFARAAKFMRDATAALGGTFVANPTWNRLTNQQLLTGHPLGGCPMADDATRGAVDHRGQVYAGAQGTAVHDGLYVMDAAIIPRSLGVNPLLVICALAERAAAHLAAARGWPLRYEFL
ncbi:MAG: GMC family oxidoreductase [Rhodocyclaceae bacterium]|nr:GMC family oxidoreductase [Rhodocyclaceae bacterium]